MEQTNSTVSLARRSFIRSSVITGAAIGSIGSVQANDDDETSSHEAPDEEINPQDVEYQEIEDADVVIYKNCQPWEVPANEIALQELGVSYSVLPPTEAENIGSETVAIIPSTQDPSFYEDIYRARDAIRSWVDRGGTLVGHMTASGWPCNGQWPGAFLPEDVRVADGELFDQIGIVDTESPIVDNLTERDLSGWGASSHGYFETIPDTANIICGLDDNPRDIPSYIEYEYGDGAVLATMQTMEWGLGHTDEPLPLINELVYAVEGAGDVPNEDSDIALDDLTISSTIDEEAVQGEQIEVTATATNTTEESVSETIAFTFDGERLAEIDVDLAAGETTDIFTDLDVGTVVEPGETTTGFVTAGVQQQDLGQLTPADTMGTTHDKEDIDPADTAITIDNGAYQINLSAERSRDWIFGGDRNLYEEFYALEGADGSVVTSRDEMTVIDEYPAEGEPGETYSATSQVEAFGTVLEVERRVWLDPAEPVFEVEHEISNQGNSTVDSLSFYQYIDYDIQGASGDAGEFDLNGNGNMYQVGTHGDIYSGFGSPDAPDEFDVGPFSNVRSRVYDGNLANRPEYEGDVTTALKYDLGSLSTGSSTTITLRYAAGTSAEQIAELLGAGAGGGGGDGGDAISTDLMIRELGDVNHDGSVTISDSVFARRHIQDLPIDDQFNPHAADLNQDGDVTVVDARQISEKVIGNDPNIPEREANVENAGTQ